MKGVPDNRIVLCQPDSIKGCSLCCGLFNLRDISIGSLSTFLIDGENREKIFHTYEKYKIETLERDKFSHICPYQGFLNEGRPGCLIHPHSSGVEGRDRSLYASKICDKYFCPAHTILTYEEKIFLVEKVSDWYLYSVAIADPESFSFIFNFVKENYSDNPGSGIVELLVNEGLNAHSENLKACGGILFCYSIPEYNINKSNFCIRYINETRDLVVSRIIKSASAVSF